MRLYIIGDSISIQYGPYLRSYLDGDMEYSRKEGEEEALLNLDNPQGANSGDSGMVLSFLKSKAEAGSIAADFLLVNCGLHDIKTDPATGRRQVPIEEYRQNLRGIVRIGEKMQPRLLWIKTTPCDENVHNHRSASFHRFSADCRNYNQAADQIMKESGVPSLDLYTFTRNQGSELYCDHVHFHEHIREKQAAFIAGWLRGFEEALSA